MTDAAGSAVTPAQNNPKITRGHSCFTCSKRKVKCDGKRPCATCVRNQVECRSEKSKKPRSRDASATTQYSHLLKELKRCKELLISNGIAVESRMTGEAEETRHESIIPATASDEGHMIIQRGHPRFIDNALWRGLGSEVPNSLEHDTPDVSEDDGSLKGDESAPTGDALIFGRVSILDLDRAHPPAPRILMLWQIFLNNFDPLTKVFHAPSVQQLISDAIVNLESLSTNVKALMFSIYLCAVTTIDNNECLKITGETQATMISRFSNATQQALVKAQFLRTTDLVVLQALTLYILASRRYLAAQSLWLLTGLAIRLGQTMGLHRESSLKHLQPFETEIRRRLWWQIVIVDNRSAQMSGVAPDTCLNPMWDMKRPLNVNDSDLSPFMRELPLSHDGITEMLICTIRFEIGECTLKIKILDKGPKNPAAATIAAKEDAIDKLNIRLENLLNRCDPSIPLHLFATLLSRSALCQMRLTARHPLQYEDKGAGLPQSEKDKLFALARQIIQYDNITHADKALQRYVWHTVIHFPYEALIFLLTELFSRTAGEDIDQVWLSVNQIYEDHPEFITDTHHPVHFAIGKLTLKAWGKRISKFGLQFEGSGIAKLRASRASKTPRMTQSRNSTAFGPSLQNPLVPGITGLAEGMVFTSTIQHTDSPDLGWDYWASLLQDTGDHTFDRSQGCLS